MRNRAVQLDRHAREQPAPSITSVRVQTLESNGESWFVLSFPILDSEKLDALTPAERAVVTGILAHKSNAEIAKSRGTSTRTVVNQVAAIFRKLMCKSRAELVARVRGTALE